MKKTTKRMAVLLAAFTVMASLAACSGGGSGTKEAEPAATAAQKTEAAQEKTEAAQPAAAEDVKWPTGTVTIFVPGKAGANLDTKARLVAKYLGKELGVDAVVENRPGAGGITACTEYLTEEPNTNNIEYMAASNLAVAPIYNDCEFTADDFVTVAGLDSVENGLFVDAKLGIKTIGELKAYAEGKILKFASAGVGNDSFLVSKIVMEELGVTSDSVNGDGFGDALVNVMNGSAEVCYCALNQASQYVEDGSIVPLAVYSEENYNGYADYGFPDVPSLKNAGVDVSYSTITWFSLRKGTDEAVVTKLADALAKVYANPDFQKEFTEAGFVMLPDVSTAAVSARVETMIADCQAFADKIAN